MKTQQLLERIKSLIQAGNINHEQLKEWLTPLQYHDLTLKLEGLHTKLIALSRKEAGMENGVGRMNRTCTANLNSVHANLREAAVKVIINYGRKEESI